MSLTILSEEGHRRMAERKRRLPTFSYKVVEFSRIGHDTTYFRDRELADLGREGWELVGLTQHRDTEVAWFKRPGTAA